MVFDMPEDRGYLFWEKYCKAQGKNMILVFELLIKLLLVLVILVYLVGILFISLVSVVYFVGYAYDAIFGNSLLNMGYYIGCKIPKLKKVFWLKNLWKKIQLKEMYLRYETPLFTYCFSYTAISFIAIALPIQNRFGIIFASALYLVFYFAGMSRKCGNDEQYYEKVLTNNMDFLKLSFLPLGFVITVLGFCFTITGMKVQEIPIDFSIIQSIFTNLMNYNDETNILLLLFKMIIVGLMLLMVFYIISLPIQVISYFIISVINYFRKHKKAYVDLFKKYLGIVIYLFRSIK